MNNDNTSVEIMQIVKADDITWLVDESKLLGLPSSFLLEAPGNLDQDDLARFTAKRLESLYGHVVESLDIKTYIAVR